MGAPTFIAIASLVEETDGSIDVAFPGSIVAGDILVLVVVNRQAGATVGGINTPAGWTVISGSAAFRNGSSTLTGTMAVFYKIADGTETGSVTVTRTGDTGAGLGFAGRMAQFRGKLVENSAVNQESVASTITWNAVTVPGYQRTIIAVLGQCGAIDGGVPAGYTNAGEGGSLLRLEVNYKEDVSSGASVTASGGDTTDGWATVHFTIFNPLGRSFIVN